MADVNVTLSTIGLSVTGDGSGVSLKVQGSSAVALTVGGGVGPAAAYNTSLTQLIGVNPVAAGKNISISTAGGSYTINASDPPVQSVQGRTGSVVLTIADLSAASSTHTHSTSDVVSFKSAAAAASPVQSVQGRTGSVVLAIADLSAASSTHTHSTSDVVSFKVAAASAAPVQSVQGRTGSVVLTLADLSAAQSSHTHLASHVSNLTNVANVVSVNGVTGTPTIVAGSNVTVVTSGSSITISSSGSGTSGGAVSSVNGKTGTVSLTYSEVSAAAASHTHVAANVTDLTSVANVVSVNGRTGVVSLSAAEVTAASASHSHDYVTSLNGKTGSLSVVAGSNITVTTNSQSIVIDGPAMVQGPKGDAGSFGNPQTISAKTSNYTLQLSDVGSLLTFYGNATSSPITVTIPQESSVSWVAGSHIDLVRLGSQRVVVSGSVGIYATPSAELRAAYSGGSLVYLGSDQWLLVGDLA